MSVIACHFCDRILYACGRSPLVILFALVAALVGCPWDGVDPRPVFAVSIAPHGYLLERIGGDKIRVAVLVPTGKEPESYQPRPGDMTALSRAKALFCTGMPFEAALIPKLKSVAPDLKCLDLREGLALRALELHSHAEGTGATELVHSASCAHDGLDPHIWFAPGMLKRQADAVLSVLIEYAPENADDFRRNHEELVAELESLHAELAEKLAPFRGRTVFVFHPSYGYFCDEFGLVSHRVDQAFRRPHRDGL